MSNCKEGDIARIVRTEIPQNLDKLVTVVMAADEPGVWLVEALQPLYGWDGDKLIRGMGIGEIADRNLKPIRDRGDDAEDETHTWRCGYPPVVHVVPEVV